MNSTGRMILLGLFVFSSVLAEKTVLMGKFDGPRDHADLFHRSLSEALISSPHFKIVDRNTMNSALAESQLANSDLTTENEKQINLRLADMELNVRITQQELELFSISLTAVDLQSLEVLFLKTIEYEDHSFVEKVSEHLIQDLGSSLFPRVEPPIEIDKQKFLMEDSLWKKLGMGPYDWTDYFQAQSSFDSWAKSRDYSVRTSGIVALIPGYSGMNYTRNWGVGILISVAEITAIAYGLYADSKAQKYSAFSAVLPLTFFDVIWSRKSAVRSRERITRLRDYYKARPYPFEFMKN